MILKLFLLKHKTIEDVSTFFRHKRYGPNYGDILYHPLIFLVHMKSSSLNLLVSIVGN